MSVIQKRYKKLVKELLFVNSEYEYVKEAVKGSHAEFEKYYQKFCKENNVPIADLNKDNKNKLEKIFPKKKQEVNEEGLIKCNKSNSSPEDVDKTLQKMYRKIATKIHPDKFSPLEQTPEILKKSEMFKEATSAYNERKWGNFLDICDKLDILPNRYTKVMEIIREEISNLNKKITMEKATFSWRLYECEEDTSCKDKVIKNFLFQLFKYQI